MIGSGSAILWRTLKIVLAVGVISYLAAASLSQHFDREALARLAGPRQVSPLITGSIPPAVPGLSDARLDPCVMPER